MTFLYNPYSLIGKANTPDHFSPEHKDPARPEANHDLPKHKFNSMFYMN